MANARDEFKELLSGEKSKRFTQWFWKGTNGNELIEMLNNTKEIKNECIRREKLSPFIYGVVLNTPSVKFDNKQEHDQETVEYKLMKVGITQASTASDEKNRMAVVKKQIEKSLEKKIFDRPDVSIIFVLMKNPVDTSSNSDVEEQTREKIGVPIHKDVADELGLPFKKEWVLTTQMYIDLLKKNIKEVKKETKTPTVKTITTNRNNKKLSEIETPMSIKLKGSAGPSISVGWDSGKKKLVKVQTKEE